MLTRSSDFVMTFIPIGFDIQFVTKQSEEAIKIAGTNRT